MLAVLSYLLSQHEASPSAAVSNLLLSLAAIGVTAFLAEQNRSREVLLREQAGLLDLTHDTVFVRDMNEPSSLLESRRRGAVWMEGDGSCRQDHSPAHADDLPHAARRDHGRVARTGRWEGELIHTKKDGTQVNRGEPMVCAAQTPAAICRNFGDE